MKKFFAFAIVVLTVLGTASCRKNNLSGEKEVLDIVGVWELSAIYITKAAKWYKTFPDLIKILPVWMHSNGHSNLSTLRIEPKANGISVVQTLETMTNINVARTPSPTTSKAERLHAISPKIECGRVFLVEGDWVDGFIDEVCGFPSRSHDEYVDILGYAINYLDSEDWELPPNVENLF